MKNKIILLVLTFTMLLSSSVSLAYNDVDENPAIEYVTVRGIMNGYPDGSFKPDGFITREEMAKIFSKAMKNYDTKPYGTLKYFSDMVPERWSYEYVTELSQYDIINGYPDGSFKPNNHITREEFTKMYAGAFRYMAETDINIFAESSFPDVQGRWSEIFIASIYEQLLGYTAYHAPEGLFYPEEYVDREEVAEMFMKMEKRINEIRMQNVIPYSGY